MNRLVKTLVKEDGITGVVPEDREVLRVTTPGWSTGRLQEWVTGYLEVTLSD